MLRNHCSNRRKFTIWCRSFSCSHAPLRTQLAFTANAEADLPADGGQHEWPSSAHRSGLATSGQHGSRVSGSRKQRWWYVQTFFVNFNLFHVDFFEIGLKAILIRVQINSSPDAKKAAARQVWLGKIKKFFQPWLTLNFFFFQAFELMPFSHLISDNTFQHFKLISCQIHMNSSPANFAPRWPVL